MLLKHVQIGLNENRTVDWHNETTGHGGTITPEEPTTYKDLTCRYAKITNKSKNQQATTRFKFCKMEDGTWKIVSGD
jgi:surface antigen